MSPVRRLMRYKPPDPVVFGNWSSSPDYGGLTVLCRRCDVRWSLGGGTACWVCGGEAS